MSSKRAELDLKWLRQELKKDDVVLYSMIRSKLPNAAPTAVSDLRLDKVESSQLHLSCVMCKGDMCSKERVVYQPDFAKSEQTVDTTTEAGAKHFVSTLREEVLSPKLLRWTVQDPMIPLIVYVGVMLAYATYILQYQGIIDYVEQSSLQALIVSIFGSEETFAKFTIFSWYFMVVAHVAEACLVIAWCRKLFALSWWGGTARWCVLVCLVGFASSKSRQMLAWRRFFHAHNHPKHADNKCS